MLFPTKKFLPFQHVILASRPQEHGLKFGEILDSKRISFPHFRSTSNEQRCVSSQQLKASLTKGPGVLNIMPCCHNINDISIFTFGAIQSHDWTLLCLFAPRCIAPRDFICQVQPDILKVTFFPQTKFLCKYFAQQKRVNYNESYLATKLRKSIPKE